jgi:hypothetical protein
LEVYRGCYYCFTLYVWYNRWDEHKEYSGLWKEQSEVTKCRLEDIILGEIARRISKGGLYRYGLLARVEQYGFGEVQVDGWQKQVAGYLGKRIIWGRYEIWCIVREFAEFLD